MAEEAKKNKSSVSSKKKTSGTTKKKNTTTVSSRKTSTVKKSGVSAKKVTPKKTVSKVTDEEKKNRENVLYIAKNVEPEHVSISENESESRSEKEDIKKSNDLRVIPVSHYIIVGIIIVWILIFMYIGYKMTQNYHEKLYDEGYFIHEKKDIKKISLNEVNQVIQESNSTLFLFFNYRGIEETYELEKEIYQIMTDYQIKENFYYIDLTDLNHSQNDLAESVNQALGIHSLLHTPAIFYYQDGNLVTIAQREDKKVLEAADFVKVLDMYEFKK